MNWLEAVRNSIGEQRTEVTGDPVDEIIKLRSDLAACRQLLACLGTKPDTLMRTARAWINLSLDFDGKSGIELSSIPGMESLSSRMKSELLEALRAVTVKAAAQIEQDIIAYAGRLAAQKQIR